MQNCSSKLSLEWALTYRTTHVVKGGEDVLKGLTPEICHDTFNKKTQFNLVKQEINTSNRSLSSSDSNNAFSVFAYTVLLRTNL